MTALLKDSRGYLWVGSLNGLSPLRRRALPRLRRRGRAPETADLRSRGVRGRRGLGRDVGRPRADRRVGPVHAARVQARGPAGREAGRVRVGGSRTARSGRGRRERSSKADARGRRRARAGLAPAATRGAIVRVLRAAPDGSILAGTSRGPLSGPRRRGTPRRLPLSKDSGVEDVRGLLVDRAGRLWVATPGRLFVGARGWESGGARSAGPLLDERAARPSGAAGRVAGPRRDSRRGALGLPADPRAPRRARRPHDDGGPRRGERRPVRVLREAKRARRRDPRRAPRGRRGQPLDRHAEHRPPARPPDGIHVLRRGGRARSTCRSPTCSAATDGALYVASRGNTALARREGTGFRSVRWPRAAAPVLGPPHLGPFRPARPLGRVVGRRAGRRLAPSGRGFRRGPRARHARGRSARREGVAGRGLGALRGRGWHRSGPASTTRRTRS